MKSNFSSHLNQIFFTILVTELTLTPMHTLFSHVHKFQMTKTNIIRAVQPDFPITTKMPVLTNVSLYENEPWFYCNKRVVTMFFDVLTICLTTVLLQIPF